MTPPRHGVVASPRLRAAVPDDLAATARLHHQQLREGFFPRLGRRFLRAYHATFVAGPHGRAVVAELDGAVAGFVVGAVHGSRHTRWALRHHGTRLAAHGALALLVRPGALALFLRTRVLRYAGAVVRLVARERRRRAGRSTSVVADDLDAGAPAVLLHVVVDEGARGHGVGARLVDAFVASVGAAGAEEVRLVTDLDGRATDFYDRLGWERVTTRRARDGRRVVEYRTAV